MCIVEMAEWFDESVAGFDDKSAFGMKQGKYTREDGHQKATCFDTMLEYVLVGHEYH